MSTSLLFIVALAAMAGLAALRLTRVHFGRTPIPETGRRLFILAFFLVPPVALGALSGPDGAAPTLRGFAWVPMYALILVGLAVAMWVVAVVAQIVVRGRARPLMLLALVGSEGDPEDIPFDPPLTAKLAQDLAVVDRANAVFPRGWGFPVQIDRAGFRRDWDALDSATSALEAGIADDHRLGVAVADEAKATATDARSRLDTLRRLAGEQGQAWAT